MRARLTSAVSSARAMVIVSETMRIQDCGPPNAGYELRREAPLHGLVSQAHTRRDELSPYTLDHVHRVLRRHHVRQIEARLLIELSELRLCALAPASSQ